MPDSRPPQPLVDARALARQLDRLARAEAPPWLHQEVARRMAERLVVMRETPSQWLDWWAWLGAGAQPVQALWPQAERRVVEPTPALAERSRATLQAPWWAWRRRQALAQAVLDETAVPPGQAQMLWASMVLHAVPDPVALMARWHAALAVGGFLMFSSFGPDTWRELRSLYAAAGWPAPHPPFTDMHDIGDQLVHAGFADPVMDQETLRLHWSSPEALLAELRSLGGHLGAGRLPGLRTPRWRQRLLAALAERADSQGRIGLTVEIVYGHAFKAAPRARPGEPVTVSLDGLLASMKQGRPLR
ncbi:class I SAM-dependent methyltransferase [Aquabacterium sp. OR-4]|uniref:class I SAM-dependent methyltransferase n=1 Tax=Aquabacterium sp. OR-4 TaxID=2978127 RepID=UPI0021B39897|nr:class I SAM-dependent methyltransferase [Aquabacterium sp. OR-4]MDT7834441.1 class I SAM-dependent methyltransferase [Aquabacterium sp. OR-4]